MLSVLVLPEGVVIDTVVGEVVELTLVDDGVPLDEDELLMQVCVEASGTYDTGQSSTQLCS
jgi:hypothetical protein